MPSSRCGVRPTRNTTRRRIFTPRRTASIRPSSPARSAPACCPLPVSAPISVIASRIPGIVSRSNSLTRNPIASSRAPNRTGLRMISTTSGRSAAIASRFGCRKDPVLGLLRASAG